MHLSMPLVIQNQMCSYALNSFSFSLSKHLPENFTCGRLTIIVYGDNNNPSP